MKITIEKAGLKIETESILEDTFLRHVLHIEEHGDGVILYKNVYSKTDTEVTTLLASKHNSLKEIISNISFEYTTKEHFLIEVEDNNISCSHNRLLNKISKELMAYLLVNNLIRIDVNQNKVNVSLKVLKQ